MTIEALSYSESNTSGSLDQRTPRQRYMARLRRLEQEAATFVNVWEESAQHFMPGSVRTSGNDRTLSPLPNPDIMNGVGTLARRTFESGMMSNMSSPARIWAALGTTDTDKMKYQPVKIWYHKVSEWMFAVFARSNLYNVLPKIYGTLGAHGTACALVEQDPLDLVRFYPWTNGSFFLSNGPRLEVDTAYRKLQMTVLNMVRSFGQERCSQRVRNMYANKQYDEWIDIVRVIEPNLDRKYGKLDYTGMPITSCWFEVGERDQGFLRESGYFETPILAPRWEVEGEDVYGKNCPGMLGLPDSRMLQQYGRREAQVVDYLTAPPVEGPSGLGAAYPMPGDVVKVPFTGPQNAVRRITEHPPQSVTVLDAKQMRLENRVNEWWFAHLWLAIEMDKRNQRATAREIAERHEEKLIQLGPVLVRSYHELFDVLIENTVQIGVRMSMPFWLRDQDGILPLPPEELQNEPIKVEYISPLALAMKLVGITANERLAGFTGSIYAVYPEIVDKLNWDRLVEGHAERLSADPDIIVPQDQVDAKRADRNQKAQQQNLITELGPAAAQSARALSETDVNGDSALNRLLAARGLGPAFGGR